MSTAYFLTHPIQYQSPMIRHMAANGMNLHVIYGCNPADERIDDAGFGIPITWDIPLLEGYSYEVVCRLPELPPSAFARFATLVSRASDALRRGSFSEVWIHGWGNPLPVIPFYPLAAFVAARRHGLPIIMRGETHLKARRGGWLRKWIHRTVLKQLFRRCRAFLPIGTANAALYLDYGVPEERLFPMPHAVDNHFFRAKCAEASVTRDALRSSLGFTKQDIVVLFAGRLAEEKDPLTLLDSISLVRREQHHLPVKLLFVGEGPLRKTIENKVTKEGLADVVSIAGFKNQTELPGMYSAGDVLVLPSTFEPWGLVVNEAMNAGRPVIVSDNVGCAPDLIKPGINGDTFAAGNVCMLARKLLPFLLSEEKRREAGAASLSIIGKFSFEEDLKGLRDCLKFVQSGMPVA